MRCSRWWLRQGIGTKLVEAGLERVARRGWGAVFVVGDPAYYGRFAFSKALAGAFETPYPRDYFMALELASGRLAGLAGEVVYAAPFQDLD